MRPELPEFEIGLNCPSFPLNKTINRQLESLSTDSHADSRTFGWTTRDVEPCQAVGVNDTFHALCLTPHKCSSAPRRTSNRLLALEVPPKITPKPSEQVGSRNVPLREYFKWAYILWFFSRKVSVTFCTETKNSSWLIPRPLCIYCYTLYGTYVFGGSSNYISPTGCFHDDGLVRRCRWVQK